MNFSNLDVEYNARYLKEGRVETEVAYMGCVQKDEIINYKLNGKQYIEGIGRAYNRVKSKFGESSYGISKYVDTSKEDVYVYDSSKHAFVQCKKFIENPNKNNWVRIKTTDGRSLTATLDHPLPVVDKGRTFVRDIIIGDKLYSADEFVGNEMVYSDETLNITEILPVDVDENSYDLETESDMFDVSGIMSHNCRTRVIGNSYDPSREIVTGRGNLSFTTINLPRVALLAGQDNLADFFTILDKRLEVVKRQLLERFKIQCMKHPRNYPFLMGQGVWIDSDKLTADDDLTEVLKHGTFSIGFIGLAECLVALIGKHHGESDEAQELGLKIVSHIREFCDRESQAMQLNFTCLATPAEGLSGRFVKIDRKKFGSIPGVTDRDYYTNSMHIPVHYKISAFKKINIEAPYHALTNAGHIAYIEMDGDPSKNLEAFERVIRAMHDAGIGYGAINHPVDYDPICGYHGIIDEVCPRCGRKEGEPMTEEMWIKLKGKTLMGNSTTCGTCGNPDEEADRVSNSL